MVTTASNVISNNNTRVLKLRDNTVLFSLTQGAFGIQRKIDASLLDVDADKDLIKAQKVLLDCPEIEAIKRLDGEIRNYLIRIALPSPFKRGIYLLPTAVLERIEGKMKEFSEKRAALVEELLDNYEERVGEQASRLRATFDATDYPPKGALRSHYVMVWQYLQLEVPNQLPPALQESEREKMAEMWKEAVSGVEQVLRSNLLSLCAHLQERLTPGTDGQPKIFRDSAVQNIKDFLALFDIRNVADDAELATVVEKVRELVDGTSPEVLRNNQQFRDKVKSEFGGITATLDGMITDAPRRRKIMREGLE